MISSDTILDDKKNFDKTIDSYYESIADLKKYWKGDSFNNLLKKVREYRKNKSVVVDQFTKYFSAVNIYNDYIELLKDYEKITKEYNSSSNNDDSSKTKDLITEKKNLINDYEKKINEFLKDIEKTTIENVVKKSYE